MDELASMFSRILCPIDGSEASLAAVRLASELAKAHQGELTLLHVIPTPVMELLRYRSTMLDSDTVSDGVRDRLTEQADQALAEASRVCGRECQLEHRWGHPSETICEVAGNGYDVVVVGCRGRTGLARLALGSVSHYVVSHSPIPVLVARHD